jgi:hypothetical protein
MRRFERDCLRLAHNEGVADATIVKEGRCHQRITGTVDGKKLTVIISSTPGEAQGALFSVARDIRRKIRELTP